MSTSASPNATCLRPCTCSWNTTMRRRSPQLSARTSTSGGSTSPTLCTRCGLSCCLRCCCAWHAVLRVSLTHPYPFKKIKRARVVSLYQDVFQVSHTMLMPTVVELFRRMGIRLAVVTREGSVAAPTPTPAPTTSTSTSPFACAPGCAVVVGKRRAIAHALHQSCNLCHRLLQAACGRDDEEGCDQAHACHDTQTGTRAVSLNGRKTQHRKRLF